VRLAGAARLGRIPAVLVTAVPGLHRAGRDGLDCRGSNDRPGPQDSRIPEANIQAKLHSVNAYFVAALSKVTKTAKDVDQNLSPAEQAEGPQGDGEWPFSVRVLSSPASPLQVFGGMFGTLVEVLGTAGIVIVLVVFFLVRRGLARSIHPPDWKGHVTVTTQMLEDAGARVSRYLSMLFIINATFGIAVGIGLYLIGVPNAVLWGILATTLRFIPYIGPWIAAAMPIGLSMAISTGWVAPILTVVLFVVLELFSNNVMEPWLYGKSTGMSAVAVSGGGRLLDMAVGSCRTAAGDAVDRVPVGDRQARSATVLFGYSAGHEPVFEPKKRIYQRLLAGDQEEARIARGVPQAPAARRSLRHGAHPGAGFGRDALAARRAQRGQAQLHHAKPERDDSILGDRPQEKPADEGTVLASEADEDSQVVVEPTDSPRLSILACRPAARRTKSRPFCWRKFSRRTTAWRKRSRLRPWPARWSILSSGANPTWFAFRPRRPPPSCTRATCANSFALAFRT
jgi:hypothetical protein